MRTLIGGARVVDPAQGLDGIADLLIVDGRIEEVGPGLDGTDAEIVDAHGLVAIPGLIDLHAHLREPGGEHKETIASGARAAAAGGFTAVCAMPDTDPVIDDPAAVGFVAAEGRRAGAARVYPVGAISVRQEGVQLTEVGELVAEGAVAITDSGVPVTDSGLMRRALEYAQAFGIPVVDHPEDSKLVGSGVMNEGVVSSRLGLRGRPTAAEDVQVLRDLILADFTKGRLHLQRITTGFGASAIRAAKDRGVRVTAEVTPHHLVLTEEAVEGYDTAAKVNPPLRSEEDRRSVLEALIDGTIDAIATDHAPHHYDEKERAFDDAPCGVVGLETAFPLLHTRLVLEGHLELGTLVHRMSTGPALAFDLPGGSLAPGRPADIALLDLDRVWTVDAAAFLSKSRNTPFAGWEVRGRVVRTMVGGETVWSLPAP